MELLLWIILGGAAGWMASLILGTATSLLTDIILGIVGALAGGFIMSLLGQPGVTGFNWYSLLVAVLGSIVLIWLGRVFQRSAP